MKVLLRAPLLTNSGYGVHSRQVFEWLVEKDIDLDVECLKWGNTPWILDANDYSGIVSKIMERSKPLTPPYDVTFQLQLPDEWDPNLGNYNVGMSAFVETDKCSSKWVDCCNKMDAVVVPSTFTKNVVKRSGMLNKKIHVIPEWFNENIGKTDSDNILEQVDTEFNHLIIAQLTAQDTKVDRKNLINTLKWLFEIHNSDSDAGIVIKTNLGRGSKKDKIMTEKFMSHIVEKYRKGSSPAVHLIHGNMSSQEIAKIYASDKISSYVTATRGEGYGLPIVDAAAAGIPIVATNWSGHLEFLKPGSFIPVDYSLEEISEERVDDRIFYKGFKWADPSKQSFFSAISELKNDYPKHRETAKNLSADIHEKFSKQNIKKMYDNIFKEII